MSQRIVSDLRPMIMALAIVTLTGCGGQPISVTSIPPIDVIDPEDLTVSSKQYRLTIGSFPQAAAKGVASAANDSINEALQDSLRTLLSQSRTFIVEESTLAANVSTTPQVDYLILIQVTSFTIVKEGTKQIQISGETVDVFSGHLEVSCKVVEVSTQQTKWFVRKIFQAQESNAAAVQLRRQLIDQASRSFVPDIVETIEPPRIIKVMDDHVRINHRQNKVQIGDRFHVVAFQGGSSQGQRLIAIVEISRVFANYSEASVTEGVILSDTAEMVLYRINAEEPTTLAPRFEDADGDGFPDYLDR